MPRSSSAWSSGVGVLGEERPDGGHAVQGRAERGRAARFGQHELAPGPGQRPGDAVGREVRLDGQVHPAGLEDRQDGGHPVQVAFGHHGHDALAAKTPGQQGPGQPVRPGVELGVGPLPVAAGGRDGVRVHPDPLLEQLVHPPVRALPVRSGQPVELEAELGRAQQGLPPVLGLRVGGDQRQRGEVIAGDPGRRVRVERLGPVPQPQREPAPVRPDAHPQHGARRQRALAAQRVKHRLEGRPGQAELARQIADREVLVSQQLPLGPVGLAQHRPPRTGCGLQPARQRHAADPGQVAGHHLGLAAKSREHLGVRGQQHRAERHAELGGPLPQRGQQVAGNQRLADGHPGTGSRVHRGIGVNPPPVSTPCQNSRSESTKALVGLIVVMSHLPRGVSPPPRVRRDLLALHQE